MAKIFDIFKKAEHTAVDKARNIQQTLWRSCDALVIADIAARHVVEAAHLPLVYVGTFLLIVLILAGQFLSGGIE